jgi:hypothetical protein
MSEWDSEVVGHLCGFNHSSAVDHVRLPTELQSRQAILAKEM